MKIKSPIGCLLVALACCASAQQLTTAEKSADAKESTTKELVTPPPPFSPPPSNGWSKETKEKLDKAVANYAADQVSACLTFQDILRQEKDRPTGIQREWLEEAVGKVQPRALAVLERDFKTAAAERDLRSALVASAVASKVQTNALPAAVATIARLKSELLSGKPPAKPVWRLHEPKGEWLKGPYTEGQFNNQITLTPKAGFQMLRVTAEVENVSSSSDPPYIYWTANEIIRLMEDTFGSEKSNKPQRWATDTLIFLVTPGGDLIPCNHVCEDSEALRGVFSATLYSKDGKGQSMVFGGRQVEQGRRFTADVIFSVPEGIEDLRLLILGSAPEPVAIAK